MTNNNNGNYKPPITTEYKPPTTTYYGTGGYQGTAQCSHFRAPLPVDKTHLIYLSSSRDFDTAFRQDKIREVDTGIYLDTAWKSRLNPTPVTYTSGVIESSDLPAQFKLANDFAKKWDGPEAKVVKVTGVYIPWADASAPPLPKLNLLLSYANGLIDSGAKLEIACIGGHGRTGTLAALILLSRNPELTARDAILMIREAYCNEAIESAKQIERIYEYRGEEPPKPTPKVVTNSYATPKQGNYVIDGKKPMYGDYPMVASDRAELRAWFTRPVPWERTAFRWDESRKRKEVVEATQIPVDTSTQGYFNEYD